MFIVIVLLCNHFQWVLYVPVVLNHFQWVLYVPVVLLCNHFQQVFYVPVVCCAIIFSGCFMYLLFSASALCTCCFS